MVSISHVGVGVYRIAKTFRFSASHQLLQLPEGHKCRRMHGHSYSVTLILQAEALDGWDFVKDYGALRTFGEWVNVQLDHRHLNDVLRDRREDHPKEAIRNASIGDITPTAENIAKWIYDRWQPVWSELVAVRVSESPDTWAEYSL